MGRGNRTNLAVTGAPRFQELIAKRVAVIEHETVSTEQVAQIEQELEFIAPSLIETLKDAKTHGASSPTFLHDGVVFTVHAARVNYGAYKKGICQTVLAVEREVPAVRLSARGSHNYERQLLLLQPLEVPRKRFGTLQPYSWWDENLSHNEAHNLQPAPDEVVIAFAESSADIFDQLVRRSEQKVGRAENGLKALASLQEQFA